MLHQNEDWDQISREIGYHAAKVAGVGAAGTAAAVLAVGKCAVALGAGLQPVP